MSDLGLRIFVAGVAGFLAGVRLFFMSFVKYREMKLIEDTPTSKIRSIALGRVEIYGDVVEGRAGVLKAPFSGRDCYYCKWTVEGYVMHGTSARWEMMYWGTVKGCFCVNDGTGEVLVDPEAAEISIPMDYETSKFDRNVSQFLKERDISKDGLLSEKRMRFREYALSKGDKVYVMGHAANNPYLKAGDADTNEANIMIQKGQDSFFFISDKKESEVLDDYDDKAFGNMYLGAGLVLFCLYIILSYLGVI